MACHVTSSSDFDKGDCVIQIKWTISVVYIVRLETLEPCSVHSYAVKDAYPGTANGRLGQVKEKDK